MKIKIQLEQTVSIKKIMDDCFHIKIMSETNDVNDLVINYSFFCSKKDSEELVTKFQNGDYDIKNLYQTAKSKYSDMGSMGVPCILKKDYQTNIKLVEINKKSRKYFNEELINKEMKNYFNEDITGKNIDFLENETLGYYDYNMFVYNDKHEIIYMPATIFLTKEILIDKNKEEFLSYITKEYETTFPLLNSIISEDSNSYYNFCIESQNETYYDYLTKNLSYAWIHPIHASVNQYKEAYKIFEDLNIIHIINDANLDGIKYEYALFGKVLLSIMNPSLIDFLFGSTMDIYHKSLNHNLVTKYRLWEEEEKIIKPYLQNFLLEKMLINKDNVTKKNKI